MVSPEKAPLIDEFEYSIGLYQFEIDVQEHHNSNEVCQVEIFKNLPQLKKAFEELVNPF